MLTHDLGRVWEEQYRPRSPFGGLGMPIDAFFSLTPQQLFRAFFKAKPEPGAKEPEHDMIAFLRNINRHRASIGLRPETPAWLMPEVPRG